MLLPLLADQLSQDQTRNIIFFQNINEIIEIGVVSILKIAPISIVKTVNLLLLLLLFFESNHLRKAYNLCMFVKSF